MRRRNFLAHGTLIMDEDGLPVAPHQSAKKTLETEYFAYVQFYSPCTGQCSVYDEGILLCSGLVQAGTCVSIDLLSRPAFPVRNLTMKGPAGSLAHAHLWVVPQGGFLDGGRPAVTSFMRLATDPGLRQEARNISPREDQ